jgi:hypothetical protein
VIGSGSGRSDVDLADATFGLGVDLHPEVGQALVQARNMFLIAR